MLHRELLIGGHFFGGPCDQSVAKSVSRNPYNGHTVGTAAEAGWTEAQAAAEAAAKAFGTWRFSSRSERRELLLAIQAGLASRADELADLMRQEIGKPIALAKGEVQRAILTFGLAAEAAMDFGKEAIGVTYDPRDRGHRVSAHRFPIGPILAIAPYNWPINLAAHKLAPALATGNTVVLKGSEKAPLCTLTLGQIIHEAGCPDGVVNALNADARTTERLAGAPEIAMISFTGSPTVGWHIKRSFPEKRVVLELGGNAFAILAQDADVQAAATKLAASAFGYAGQVCISAQHVLVHQSRYDEARAALIAATEALVFGDPEDAGTLCGPMIDQAAAERVEGLVQEALAMGATRLAGGERKREMMPPTLLEGVPPTARLSREEAFGPVLTIEPFATLDEAMVRVNDSEYGIHASLFTNDDASIQEAYRRLEVGGLIVNDAPTLRFDAMPYGGVKRSGFGREGVRIAMDEMTEPKTLVIAPD